MTSQQGITIITLTAFFELLATIAVVLRFWSLRIQKRSLARHDSLIILGYTTVTGLTVVLILSVTIGGLGSPPETLVPSQTVALNKILLPLQVFYSSSITLSRLSILNLYVSLFGKQAIRFRYTCYFMMLVCFLWWVGETIMIFAVCRPFAYNWDQSIDGTCGNRAAGYMSVSALNLIIDFAVTILPAHIIWKLHMPTARKIGILIMFSLGIFICAITIARLVFYQGILDINHADFTTTSTKLYIFTSIEPQLAVTLACVPLLGPVNDKFAGFTKIAWMKSLFTSNSVTGKSSDPAEDSSYARYINMGSTDGSHHDAEIERGVKSDHFRPPLQALDDDRRIYVTREFELQDIKTSSGRFQA